LILGVPAFFSAAFAVQKDVARRLRGRLFSNAPSPKILADAPSPTKRLLLE
jgi:hypothetical protein